MIMLIFGGFILAAVAGLFYLYTRFKRFLTTERWNEYWKDKKWIKRFIAALPVLALILYCVFDLVNGVIVIINIAVIWLMTDVVGLLVRKITKKKPLFYWAGFIAIFLSFIYLGSGWYFAHHVFETDYHLVTQKDIGMEKLRVVQIADSHIGATFDGDGFERHMEKIQAVNPDIVVVVGDYVDDDTTKADMIKSCEALGSLKTTYGVYYVYGNHDKGYFNTRDFTYEDMCAELTKNNVTVLEDKTVLIADNIYIIGRKDRSTRDRADMNALTKDLDLSKYMIVLDHQPHDFDAQAETGVDLVLCGHTHGGQMFPVGITGELTGANDKTYGLETRENTSFIVTSGISDWAIRYKTGGAIAEFVVIDIEKN
ncbi:MAG: metallophosphoesterase [Lachnospiraceae bacterium]|nr:metallophosphoesterase [Lachnospiraceae bacterium]